MRVHIYENHQFTCSHEGNLRAEELGNCSTHFFFFFPHPLLRLGATTNRASRTEFMNQIMYIKRVLAFCKTSIYYPSGKYKLSIRFFFFLEYCYTVVFVQYILCLSKGCLVHDRNVHKTFSALSFTVISVVAFTCNNTTFSVSFLLNEILFLH